MATAHPVRDRGNRRDPRPGRPRDRPRTPRRASGRQALRDVRTGSPRPARPLRTPHRDTQAPAVRVDLPPVPRVPAHRLATGDPPRLRFRPQQSQVAALAGRGGHRHRARERLARERHRADHRRETVRARTDRRRTARPRAGVPPRQRARQPGRGRGHPQPHPHRAERLRLPDYDFWLFDSKTLVQFAFDDEDTTLGVYVTQDPAEVLAACQARGAAWHHAIPTTEFARRVRSTV